ncbi:MAG: cytochrome c [Geminicoccaceae bacterium]|nr:cytochrome c [Geminicoccaceae bacterium]MCX8099642.1 cytochrome c [Geminicoccaceae bacterium]MDW8369342.1 cytochrome c [Geminicoccaceae bacterium]
MSLRRLASTALLATLLLAGGPVTVSGSDKIFDDPPPPLPKELLQNAKLIARGDEIWKEQCTHCHGSKAYPGKAPKLVPRRYTPEFVWDRVHNGFRGMPPWKEVYSEEDIIAIVAYVLSDDFWP